MMRNETINTAEGTTAAADPSSLPVPLEPSVVKKQSSQLSESRGRARKKQFNSGGLSCLDSVDLISIEVDRSCLSCRLDKSYSVRDVTGDKVILTGVQDFNAFNFDSLKNVLLRDKENLPVARVCFKQKSALYPSMALAVYAPCDVLVGTGEETSGVFMFSSKLLLRNADGDELFVIEYNNKILNSNYSIKSANEQDTEEVARILDKSKHKIRLQITSKMNITSKVVLIGLCIGLVNKFTPPNKGMD